MSRKQKPWWRKPGTCYPVAPPPAIFFDRSKVVQDFTMSASKVETSHGLITR